MGARSNERRVPRILRKILRQAPSDSGAALTLLLKIFLTGKQGMLARAIAEVLSPREQVSGASHAEADIAEENAMRTVLEAAKPDVVVNAAAFTDVDAFETQRELAFGDTEEGPLTLA